MFYPDFSREKVNILINEGGLGDTIARLPAIKYISERHPHLDPQIWVADYFYDVAKNCLPELSIFKFSQRQTYNDDLPARSTGARWFTNLKTHMVDHAFCLIANELPPIEHRNYIPINTNPVSINRFNLPKKYVVISTGFTAPIREFVADYVNTINDYIISKGYKIVFLGQRQTDTGIEGHEIIGNFRRELDFSKGIDLRNKTTLLEAAKILSKAQTVVGLDNGILHLAACTEIPIVGGYTSVDPLHRMPYRHNELGWLYYPVVPPDSEPEKFAQSRWDFTFEHDFRFSYYNNDSLIKSVTPELYIEQLEKVL